MTNSSRQHINYETIWNKLKSIFSTDLKTPSISDQEIKIKAEPAFITKDWTSDEDDEYEKEIKKNKNYSDPAETYYIPGKPKKPQQWSKQKNYHKQRFTKNRSNHATSSASLNWRENHNPKTVKGKNPLKNNQPARCNICQRINHWSPQYPDRNTEDATFMVHKLLWYNCNDMEFSRC